MRSPTGLRRIVRLFLAIGCLLVAEPALAQLRTGLFVANRDGGDVRLLLRMPNHRWHGSPAWSHDGKHVAFDAYPTNVGDGQIFMANADGSDPKLLGYGCRPVWSGDDQQLAFFVPGGNRFQGEPGVYVMNTDGKSRERLADGDSPRWSPDGGQLAISRNSKTEGRIFLYDLVEQRERAVVDDHYNNLGGVSWSPDGKRLAVVARKGNKKELLLVNVNELNEVKTRWSEKIADGCPAWSADGRTILLTLDTGKQQLHALDPDNDEAPRLLDNQNEGKVNSDPAWSSDGKSIIFASDRGQ